MDLPLRFPLRIDGKDVGDGPRAQVRDPWRGEVVGEIVLASEQQAEVAVAAAVRAFEKTRRMPSFEKKRLLQRISSAVEAQGESFAELMAREAGKPIALARAEVKRAVMTLELGAEEAARMGGEVMPLDLNETSAGFAGGYTRVPAGPVIAMAPFNFPLNLVCHKLAPALASGCSVVLKPPPQAPLTALKLGELVLEAGAPAGAFQVLPCDVGVAETLVRDDRFATLSFTGSAKVGWHLKSVAGKKRVLLELGGNAAIIVHDDADLGWAMGRTLTSAFAYAGQVCIKGQRLFVHDAVYDSFVSELVRRASELAVRDPLDPASLVSSVIDEASAKRIESWVNEATDQGVERLCGGPREGTRIPPTVLRISSPQELGLKVVAEEIFGPVLTVHRYATWEDAVALAGATRYGLQAGLFTQNLGRVRQAFEGLQVGALIINDSPSFRVDAMPYGGVKDSGLGREGVRFAMEEMTERKLLVIRG